MDLKNISNIFFIRLYFIEQANFLMMMLIDSSFLLFLINFVTVSQIVNHFLDSRPVLQLFFGLIVDPSLQEFIDNEKLYVQQDCPQKNNVLQQFPLTRYNFNCLLSVSYQEKMSQISTQFKIQFVEQNCCGPWTVILITGVGTKPLCTAVCPKGLMKK